MFRSFVQKPSLGKAVTGAYIHHSGHSDQSSVVSGDLMHLTIKHPQKKPIDGRNRLVLIFPCFPKGLQTTAFSRRTQMRKNRLLASVALAAFSLLLAAAEIHANGAIALTGQVSSQKEKLMEGV